MKAGTILFNGADLALYGAPRFTIKRTPEPAAPARATHRRVEITVSVDLQAEMPATVWARAEALARLLAATAEGQLEIRSENGAGLVWQATPGDCSLPEAISRRGGRVEMNFTARETLAEGASAGLTIDPMDGSSLVTISRVQDWSENVRISRPDSRSAVRSEVASTLAFGARTAYADPLLALDGRISFLLAEAERVKALDSKQARVSFAGFDRTVQFESFSAKPSPGWEWLEVEAQARYVTLPGDTEAEVEFKVESSEDPATGETKTTVNGKIEAPSKAMAQAKAEAILTAWRTPGRRAVKIVQTDSYLDGEDCTSPEWIGLDFSYEFSESGDESRYTLKIDTTEGADGRKITYSGTANAKDLATLTVLVASVAGNKHPVELRSSLGVEYATDDHGALYLVQASFSHEYAASALFLRGSVTRVASKGSFTDHQVTVSGSISARSYTAARSQARGFIESGKVLRQDDETEEKAFYEGATQFVTLAFSYTWATSHTTIDLKYEEVVAIDYSRMVKETSVSGVCFAANKSAAEGAAKTLATAMGGANPTRQSFSNSSEKSGSAALWLALNFSFSFESPVTGTIGHDIIEASFALQRIGMVNHEPMTEIPLGMPVKQGPFGYNIGRLVASGTVKARIRTTAKDWGQGKRELANLGQGAEDPPDERMSEVYVPFNGKDVAFYEFSFQYGFRYADGLIGLM